MIRAMRPTDAMALRLLRPRDRTIDVTAGIWPKGPPESRHPSLLSLLRDATLPAPTHRQIGVSVSASELLGLVVLRYRAGGLVWDVEHLEIDRADTGVELLRWVQERARSAAARRVILHTPADGPGAEVARRAGFERYTEGVSYRLARGFSQKQGDALPARPRLRSDESAIFQLYVAAVPANVRAAEALTQEEWAALYPGKRFWAPSVLGDRQDYVWEMASRLVGWMRVVFGQRSQFLDLLVHPLYEAYADKMVRCALDQLSPKAPVTVDTREYQGASRAALERSGFESGEAYAAWACQIASRVPAPRAAPVRPRATPV